MSAFLPAEMPHRSMVDKYDKKLIYLEYLVSNRSSLTLSPQVYRAFALLLKLTRLMSISDIQI